jgi:archaeosine-15-forming tRNA-guanine transglycosylase
MVTQEDLDGMMEPLAAATPVEEAPKQEKYEVPAGQIVIKKDSVPFRKKGETHEQYIDRLVAVIKHLDEVIVTKQQDYLDVVNENNVVPKAYVDEALRKYHILMSELKKFGLYVGQEL